MELYYDARTHGRQKNWAWLGPNVGVGMTAKKVCAALRQ